MRKWITAGWTAVIVMTLVSATFNFIFGWRLGENSHTISSVIHDGFVYGSLSVAADVIKITFGIMTIALFMNRGIHPALRSIGVAICAPIWILATVYALNSAFGSVAQNRTDMAGIREAKSTNYEAVNKQLQHVQQQREWLEKHRASATVEAEMARERQSHLWSRSKDCTDATVTESRTFCQNYYALVAELGTAKRDDELALQGEKLRASLAAAGGRMIADPHAHFINELTGFQETSVVLAWMMLLVALVEGGSTLGPVGLYLVRQNLMRSESREAASGAAEISAGVAVASQVSSPVPDAPSQPETASGEGTGGSPSLEASRTPVPLPEVALETPVRKSLTASEKPSPDVVAEVVTQKSQTADVTPEVIPPSPEVGQPKVDMLDNVLAFPKSGKRGKGRKEGAVARWAEECTSQTDDPKVKATSADVRRSYVAWCDANNLHPVKQKTMSRQLGVILRRDAGKGRGPRDAKGSIFPGLLLADPRQFQRRASA